MRKPIASTPNAEVIIENKSKYYERFFAGAAIIALVVSMFFFNIGTQASLIILIFVSFFFASFVCKSISERETGWTVTGMCLFLWPACIYWAGY